jgi:hypothetical protein
MRATTTTLEDMKNWVDDVIANDRLGICLCHQLVSSPVLATEWGIADFQAFIDYLVESQVPVITIDEAYRLQSGPVSCRTGATPHSKGGKMDPHAEKLAKLLGDAELADALVKAGLRNPALIRQATDKELEAVPGIGKATRQALRLKFAKRDKAVV